MLFLSMLCCLTASRPFARFPMLDALVLDYDCSRSIDRWGGCRCLISKCFAQLDVEEGVDVVLQPVGVAVGKLGQLGELLLVNGEHVTDLEESEKVFDFH